MRRENNGSEAGKVAARRPGAAVAAAAAAAASGGNTDRKGKTRQGKAGTENLGRDKGGIERAGSLLYVLESLYIVKCYLICGIYSLYFVTNNVCILW